MVEETVTTEVIIDAGSHDGELVVADIGNDFVAEEVVVVDASGGSAINTAPVSSAISAPNGRKDINGKQSFSERELILSEYERIHNLLELG